MFIPLAVGNTWNYKIITNKHINYDTLKIISSRIINGKTYFYFNKYPIFIPPIGKKIPTYDPTPVTIDSEGNLVVYMKGKEYIVYYAGINSSGTFSSWKANGDTVLTGAGTITDCVRYYANNPDIKDEEMMVWFSKKYGLIKIQYMAMNCSFLLVSVIIK